ncbi:hypothetical protein [Streptomyces sp. NPDC050704]|uniref:hypothetical protein n=1 Tax=Streptomyces sp. NPDC050704 TaxID=3157219 RepID=UPI00343439CE
MLSSAPRIVKVTVTPILISDPPLFNFLGAHQPYTPGSLVETTPQCHDRDDVVAVRRKHPDWTQPPRPRW